MLSGGIRRQPPNNFRQPTDLTNCKLDGAFTVDVEDYFQVTAFEKRVSRANWDRYESRVGANTDHLLRILDKHNVRGTFFLLGWIAERYPEVAQRIHAQGHELASHGYWHQLVYDITPEVFANDLAQSKEAIANATGVEVSAYRAPSFSIVERSLWALDVLIEQGFKIDSSIFPISGHDRYGIPGARRDIHKVERKTGTITEYPPSAWYWKKLNIPVGGGYFRILPFQLTLAVMRSVRNLGQPIMFYTHPWEFDPDQPRISGINSKSSFRHYYGLRRTTARLNALLSCFSFGTIGQVLSTIAKNEGQSDCERNI